MLKSILICGAAVHSMAAMAVSVSVQVKPQQPPVIDNGFVYHQGTPFERMVKGPWFRPVLEVTSDTDLTLSSMSIKVTSSEGVTKYVYADLKGVNVKGGGSVTFDEIFVDEIPTSKSYEYTVETKTYGVTKAGTSQPFEAGFDFKTQ